jgi:hypothetical protein
MVGSKIVLSTQELVWLPDRLSLAFFRLIEYFPDISLYSIAVSLLSMDRRECNLIVRLEHWTIILDFPLLSGSQWMYNSAVFYSTLIRPVFHTKLAWWYSTRLLFGIWYNLSSSQALTQPIRTFWDFGFKSMANLLDLCVKSRIVSRVLEHLWWQQITR